MLKEEKSIEILEFVLTVALKSLKLFIKSKVHY